MFILQFKLREIKGRIKSWAYNTYGIGSKLSKGFRNQLQFIQTSFHSNPTYIALSFEEQRLKQGLAKALFEENKMQGQKSQIQWKMYGDRNSTCFHNSLKIKYFFFHNILDKDGNLCSSFDSI